MEVIVAAVNKATEAVKIDAAPKKHYRIQVSNTKKPMVFYLNLAKRYMKQYDVELSALGTAITTVVTIAEILKNNGMAIVKRISTSTVGSMDDTKGRLVQKAKIEILLGMTENFENLTITAVKVPVIKNSNKPPTSNTAATVQVAEKFNKLTNTAAEVPVTENSQELTTNTASMKSKTENFNESTNTAAEAPMTENSQELTTNTASMEPVTENFNKLTNTAAEAPVTENSQELTTNTASTEQATENFNESTNTADEESKKAAEKKE